MENFPEYDDSELGEEAAEELAALELMSEARVKITGLEGAAALAYCTPTPLEVHRHRWLGSAAREWPPEEQPYGAIENIFEEADRLARAAGYKNARAMGDDLKVAAEEREAVEWEAQLDKAAKRREAALKGAATRAANRRAAKLAAMSEEERQRLYETLGGEDTEAAQDTPNDGDIPTPNDGAAPADHPTKITFEAIQQNAGDFAINFTCRVTGRTFNAAHIRLILAHLQLQKGFEEVSADWWGGDTTIVDTAIAIWEDRLWAATAPHGQEEDTARRYAIAMVARGINKEYPELAAALRAWVKEGKSAAQCMVAVMGSQWREVVTPKEVGYFVERVQS